MIIYRIENKEKRNGMWYSEKGTYDPFIMKLTEGKSRELPMEYDTRYTKGGLNWYSGCHSIALLQQWFSKLDVQEMLQADYGLYKIKAKQFDVEDDQILFTQEGIAYRKEIGLADIFAK